MLAILLLIIAAIVLPNFMHLHRPPRPGEAKSNLASIATAEISYMAETGSWSDSFAEIGYSTTGKPKYTYFLTPTEYLGRPPEELGITLPFNGGYGAPIPGGHPKLGFTAVAIGNIDGDDTLDVWYITKEKTPRNTQNDVND